MIKEVIVVEGRDDESAIRRAVEAQTIPTHGYGIKKSTLALIEKAYESTGIIIFTDPDHAGEAIRKKLTKAFPQAKHAYLSREEAEKDGDIGIENASCQAIQEALEKARVEACERRMEFTQEDLRMCGLLGQREAAFKRAALGRLLGIGYGNAKVFLGRLNHYGVSREEWEAAWTSYTQKVPSEE